MDLKQIREELRRLSALAEGWGAADELPALERDLALEKLRALYDAVLFAGASLAEPGAAFSAADSAPMAVPVDLGLDDMLPIVSSGAPDASSDGSIVHAAESDTADDGAVAHAAQPDASAGGSVASVDEPVVSDITEEEPAMPASQPETVSEHKSVVTLETTAAPQPDSLPEPECELESLAASVPALQNESAPQSVPGPAPEPAPQPVPEPAPQPVVGSLFGFEEEENRRHRRKQRVIMSLYDTAEPAKNFDRNKADAGEAARPAVSPSVHQPTDAQPVPEAATALADDPVAEPAPEPAPESVTQPVSEPMPQSAPAVSEPVAVPEPVSESEPVAEPEPQPAAAPLPDSVPQSARTPVAEPCESSGITRLGEENAEASAPQESGFSQGSVLGEVINHDVQTLADVIEAPRDMASELRRREPVTDLECAIGINDKFLMIRDLFNGDAAAYGKAMQVLNGFTDLDDCMIHIAEHYAWNANSDGARLLMELLERKFA